MHYHKLAPIVARITNEIDIDYQALFFSKSILFRSQQLFLKEMGQNDQVD